MKKLILTEDKLRYAILVVTCLFALCLLFKINMQSGYIKAMEEYIYDRDELLYKLAGVDTPTPDDWELLKQALIEVESGGVEDAKGKDMDYGVLQITPIYVDEANRILGENRYTHNNALDSLKSLEMFEVIQGKRNPNKDLKTALLLHNPNAMNEHTMSYYEYKVMYNFYKLKCEWYESKIF